MDKQCTVCGKLYSAKRATSKFCSAACRVRYSRDIQDDPIIESVKVPTDDWHNSAETKTQAEIEAHYTLEKFPSVVYNIGGRVRRSPWPQVDPRSKAYA